MSTSPSSALSAEAKEFVPFVQTSTSSSIPLYVDENSVASIYPSDQGPFMIQTIYPMMISHSKVTDISTNNHLLPFPEIEFHIQPSQQQQFHIDSCSTGTAGGAAASSTSASSTSTTTSQIVLLPTTSSTPTGYYPTTATAGPPQILYSSTEPVAAFYPIDYCEQPLINFSLQQQPTLVNKSHRISSQLQRPSSFRQQHENNSSSYRSSTYRGGANSNRNSYYDYHPRRNGMSYPSHTGRGGNVSNSKRISSSYHQQDYNHYYHHPAPSSRSRGYASRASQYHDEQRKEHSDYYNHGKDYYDADYPTLNETNDDESPFEFRPEDFPSLPINQQADKTPSQSIAPTIPRSASSWNEIVSAAPRPHSTSPHSLVSSSFPSQDQQRSDRSRSFNNTKISTVPERKSSNNKNNTKKTSRSTMPVASKSKSPVRASKMPLADDDQSKDDGFIQTKQQQRRLKRKNRMKEDFSLSTDEHSTVTHDTSAQLIEQVNQIDLNEHSDRARSSAIASTKSKSPSNLDLKSNETDRLEDDQNSARVSPNSNNSSDTSDYDDAVDSLVDDQ